MTCADCMTDGCKAEGSGVALLEKSILHTSNALAAPTLLLLQWLLLQRSLIQCSLFHLCSMVTAPMVAAPTLAAPTPCPTLNAPILVATSRWIAASMIVARRSLLDDKRDRSHSKCICEICSTRTHCLAQWSFYNMYCSKHQTRNSGERSTLAPPPYNDSWSDPWSDVP